MDKIYEQENAARQAEIARMQIEIKVLDEPRKFVEGLPGDRKGVPDTY
jgi:hypothetical protein